MKLPGRLVGEAALALTFFTRLPMPRLEARHRLAHALWAAPVAGLAVALIGAAVYAMAHLAGLAAGPAAALVLAACLLATGCLHEDGLSDTADGFGGGRSRERKLEIMRDSRIGTYGAAALVLSLLLRWSALAQLAEPAAVLAALVAAHAASRGLLAPFMRLLPPARTDGLSAGVGKVDDDVALAALLIGALALLALGPFAALTAAAALALVFFAFWSLCLREIGGHTGDTTGALQQLGEATVLLVASAALA